MVTQMKIGIVGLGLIGGSLGLDLCSLGYEVFGVSRRQKTCEIAEAMGVVTSASIHFNILAPVEVLFVCTPIGSIASTVKAILPYIAPQTIITDVGSVKKTIVAEINSLWPNFIGGHPMAGTAEQGIEAAQRNLFQGAPYVLTPTEETNPIATEKVTEIVKNLGSQLYFATPSHHDRAVALISHLPVMISAALIDTCCLDSDVIDLAQQLASSGFRDTSRVGGGNPELGLMMAQYNRFSLLSALEQYRQNLDKIIDYIETENWQSLNQLLKQTQAARPYFLSE